MDWFYPARIMYRQAYRARSVFIDHATRSQFEKDDAAVLPGWDEIGRSALAYAEALKIDDARYRYAPSQSEPVLYATTYAVLLLDLFGRLNGVPSDRRAALVTHLQSAQDEKDGLFKDPAIACPRAETGDDWGWRHLSVHVLMALQALGARPRIPVRAVQSITPPDSMLAWLDAMDWESAASVASNVVQNAGVFLQTNRDVFGDATAGRALEVLYSAMDARQDLATGLYGRLFDSPLRLSDGVQAGYHIWLLYFYDHRRIAHSERIVDSILKLQNRCGGFGVKLNSSACEDIDAIDPLVRLGLQTNYRADDVAAALQRARKWVLFNRNSDGSFVFRRNEAWRYAHRLMSSPANAGSLFATWFRCLALKYLLLYDGKLTAESFKTRSPGLQFAPDRAGLERP